MAKAASESQGLLATGGGNATAAGVTTQASIAASIAVQIIVGTRIDSRLGLGAAKPTAIRFETEVPVDDLLVETDDGGWVFVQAKNSLKKGTTLTSELGKTCDEFARLWLLTTAGDGSAGWNRPLVGGRDVMLIAVGSTTSGTIKTVLPQVLNALRMGSTATLTTGQQVTLTAFRKLIQDAFDARSAPATLDLEKVLKFIHVMDFDFGGSDRGLAETRLASLLDEPAVAPAAFKTIERECQTAMTVRGRMDAANIRTALAAAGTPIRPPEGGTREALREVGAAAREILAGQREIVRAVSHANAENPIVTLEAERRLKQLRQSRFTIGFEPKPACAALGKSAESGELAAASSAARQSIFAWCARILATEDRDEAERMLVKAEEYGSTDETVLARAFLQAYGPSGNKSAAIATLGPRGTPEALTASLIIVSHEEPPEVGLAWLKNAGVPLNTLHPDGKYKVLGLQLTAGDWVSALATADSLSENDFAETPALLFLAAATNLGQAIHPDLREALQLPLPQDLTGFSLYEDASAMDRRSKAITLYKRAAIALGALGAEKAAAFSFDRALWLELRDGTLHAAALKELQDSMADDKVRLRRLPLAVAFGLKPNVEAIESDIERAMALTGGKSVDATVARLMVALMKKAPEVAAYIERHRSQLTQYYEPGYIASVEIEALAKAGRTEQARARLDEARSDIREARIISILESLIEEAEGADPVARRESEYAAQPTIPSLINLVDELRRARDFPRLANYSGRLFAELKDGASAETYVLALYEIDADDKIVEFAIANPAIVRASGNIGTTVSWAYYRLGRLREAKSMLDNLRAGRDVQSDRFLFMNIAIASGDWSSLNSFVESEWSNKDRREAVELLRAGTLAQRIGSATRSQELVREAARKADRDPDILAGAYDIASSSGWENDENIHEWLATAIETSDANGPVQRMDIREILDEQPRWNERIDRTWDLLLRGEAPMFAAAQAARRTLLDLTLRPALQNLQEADPRKRSIIFAFSGSKPVLTIRGRRLAFDITSLLSLTVTGLLRRVLDWSESVAIAHTTLSWLFEERAKLAFHQPSQVRRAREVKRLLDGRQLHRFEGGVPTPAVEQEVGEDIAKYLIAAQTVDSEDESQKVIVRSYPLHKPGSLLEEQADISGLEAHFAGCTDLIEALRAAGHLTEVERANALSFLQLHETPWPHDPQVQAGATLYLDDVALSYLQHLKLLPRLAQARFKVFVTSSEADRANELMNFDESGAEAWRAVEDLQTALRDGIQSGKVTLGRLRPGNEDDDSSEFHPSRLMVADTPEVDALVLDDRCVNRFSTTNAAHNATSIDLLATMEEVGSLSKGELTQAMTILRQAGMVLVPHLAGEIGTLLNAAPTVGSRVQETAELRAIRESITRVRMTDVLQLPAESEWIDNLTRELLSALRAQWHDTVTDDTARARSSWALRLLDARGWAHRAASAALDSVERYRAQVLMLLLFPSATSEIRDRYWGWLEDSALKEFKDEEPESYERLLASVRTLIDEEVGKALPDGGRNG